MKKHRHAWQRIRTCSMNFELYLRFVKRQWVRDMTASFQAAEKGLNAVILSEAKNRRICGIKQIQRSFVGIASSG